MVGLPFLQGKWNFGKVFFLLLETFHGVAAQFVTLVEVEGEKSDADGFAPLGHVLGNQFAKRFYRANNLHFVYTNTNC